MPPEDLPPEALEATEIGNIESTATVNGTESDVIDDQPQTAEPVPGAPA